MKQDQKVLKRTSAADFTSGIPNKKNPKDSLVNKAYSLGYQQASLMNGMQAFQLQQQQAQQDMAMATQQLLQLQAQLAEEKARVSESAKQASALSPAQAALNAGPMPGMVPGVAAPPVDLASMMQASPAAAAPAVPPMAPAPAAPPMM